MRSAWPRTGLKQKAGVRMIGYIHSTTVIVKDQDAALAFYTNKLGWEKRIDQDMGGNERFLTVAPKGAQTELVLGSPTMYGEGKGIVSGISLVADDVEATYKDLSAKGVQFKSAPETMPWGTKATWFSDPDGNEFFLTEEAEVPAGTS
jgi:predicted enzyme related to lactoylglutathione lyase